MTPLHQRLLPAGVLLTLGTVMCGLYFSGRVTAYLVPTFQPFTVVCGIILILFATLVLFAPREIDAGGGCAPHSSLVGNLLVALLVAGPVLLALATTRDQFGASMVLNRNYVTDVTQLPGLQTQAALAPLPGEDPNMIESEPLPGPPLTASGDIQAEVIDLLYAAQLPDMRPVFENKRVEIIGQLMPAKENNPNGDRYDLVRMFMTCCAADVQPIALPIRPTNAPGLPDMTWVKVTGTATFPVENGARRPLIQDATMEKTSPPQDTFLY